MYLNDYFLKMFFASLYSDSFLAIYCNVFSIRATLPPHQCICWISYSESTLIVLHTSEVIKLLEQLKRRASNNTSRGFPLSITLFPKEAHNSDSFKCFFLSSSPLYFLSCSSMGFQQTTWVSKNHARFGKSITSNTTP